MHGICSFNEDTFYLSLEPFNFCILVLKLCAKLIGSHLLCLHDLDQVDVLLHKHFTLNDEIRVAEE